LIALLVCGGARTALAAPLTVKQLLNTVYVVPSLSGEVPNDHISVKNGKGKHGATTLGVMATAVGKLGKPSQDGGAAAYWVNTGGTGDFMYLAAFVTIKGKIECIGYKTLGDRSVVNKLKIKNNQIILDMTGHAPSDSANEPTQHRVVKYSMVENKLIGPDES
jgi:hypothetical protein